MFPSLIQLFCCIILFLLSNIMFSANPIILLISFLLFIILWIIVLQLLSVQFLSLILFLIYFNGILILFIFIIFLLNIRDYVTIKVYPLESRQQKIRFIFLCLFGWKLCGGLVFLILILQYLTHLIYSTWSIMLLLSTYTPETFNFEDIFQNLILLWLDLNFWPFRIRTDNRIYKKRWKILKIINWKILKALDWKIPKVRFAFKVLNQILENNDIKKY